MLFFFGHASAVGSIGNHVMILNTGSIKNVRIGDYCHICGTCRLSNGSVNSNVTAPVHIGHGVICDDFIISSGSKVDDGTMLTRCFVGQSCKLGHNYSASDSLFFSNCQGENGEACAIFAGPFTVTFFQIYRCAGLRQNNQGSRLVITCLCQYLMAL